MVLLQEVLEGACFAFGQRELPTLLLEHGWKCAEAVALRTWVEQFAILQDVFDTAPSKDLLKSVAGIQATVVNRTPVDSSGMKKFLDDAVELTAILNIEGYSGIVKKMRLDIGAAIEDLSREEREAGDRQDKKLMRIAEERRELDKREAEVREEQERSERECQKSTELEVKRLLDEAKKSLETTTFFTQLAQRSKSYE
jgi:vacuolar-type H+-ATPase subunit I/STV1